MNKIVLIFLKGDCMNNFIKRKPPRKDERPITGEIFYPTTDEGYKELYDGSAGVVINILEKQLGSQRLDDLMKLYESKQKN